MPSNQERISVGLRWAILSVALTIMLFAGLRPRGFAFRNTASLQTTPPGLTFGPHGLAFTRPFVFEKDALEVDSEGLTFAIEVEVAEEPPNGFAAIAVLDNGDHAVQLFLGQYQEHLVLMNGDDYNHTRHLPRISIDTARLPPGRLDLVITSNSSGSFFFANGEMIDHRADLIQTVPIGGRLTLGNAPDGKHPWNGRFHRFALYRKSLDPNQLTEGFHLLPPTGASNVDQPESPWLFYQFDPVGENEGSPRRVADQSANAINLEFPLETAFLTREFLGPGTVAPYTKEITSRDGFLNLFGFVPLGWIVAGLIRSRRIRPNSFFLIVVTTAAGFTLSLGIEFIQTWMPTRSSSLLDLVLNTAGTLFGAVLYLGFARRASPPDSMSAPP